MFGEFLKRLTAPAPAPLTDTDARLALGALLVRVARSDNNYDPNEVAKINQILSNRYDLAEAEAIELRQQCEVLESEAPDTVRFTRAIKNAVPIEDRIAVIESLWAVVLTDGVRDENEDAVLRLVSDLLGVNDMDRAKARQRVDSR